MLAAPTSLDHLYDRVQRVFLARQHPVTGLLPASTAVNAHGDYTDAWVRDVVYGLLAPWGLALAYRRHDAAADRRYELEHAVVRGLRGLLGAMMRQADKVEAFKADQDPTNALHAKYGTASGLPVVGDAAWGHLQVDATALFLLQVAQVTASGLPVVQSAVEVRFVQNLVHYVSNAYRSPDFGIWERGDKANQGRVELNASSVGMAKAALEALDGFDLFGAHGSQRSVLHVAPDDIARARLVLEAMLPRESASKEVDAALLAVVGYPAFAVDDPALAERTRREVVRRLRGRHGLKRFLRDGHQTPLEDPSRLHYESEELARFEGIEAEWPLFEAYLALDAAFRGDRGALARHRARIEELALERDGLRLVPEAYVVPTEELEAERAAPGTRPRRANDNVPLLWAQSLTYLAEMLDEGLLEPADLDPLGRHAGARRRGVRRPVHAARSTGAYRNGGSVVQVALIASDESVQRDFADLGVAAQTAAEVAPVRLRPAEDLIEALTRVGACPTLGLGGRPRRRPGALATARLLRLRGDPYVFLPVATDPRSSLGARDPAYLARRLRAELAYLHRHARGVGRPTMVLALRRDHLGPGHEALLALVDDLRRGDVDGVPVRLDRLATLLPTAAQERIDDLGDWRDAGATPWAVERGERRLRRGGGGAPLAADAALAIERERRPQLAARLLASDDLEQQAAVLGELVRRDGLGTAVALGEGRVASVEQLLDEVEDEAAERRAWGVVRSVAGVRGRVDPAFVDALDELLLAQRRVVLGKGYGEGSALTRPVPVAELRERLRTFTGGDPRDQALTQELVIALADLARARPERFRGVLTLRVGALLALMATQLAAEVGGTPDAGREALVRLAPAEVVARLDAAIEHGGDLASRLRARERLLLAGGTIRWRAAAAPPPAPPTDGWWRWRQREGALARVPQGFYARVWDLLGRGTGLVIGDKLDHRHRIDADAARAATTSGEKNFALRVEHLLQRVPAAEYRHLTVEALTTLAEVAEADPDLRFGGDLVLDVLIGHAVRRAWLDAAGEGAAERYDADTAAAWAAFYDRAPEDAARWFVEALRGLTRPADAVA